MAVKRITREILGDRAGAAAVALAVALPVFVGGLGYGGEVGYWYFEQRKVQNAADVAAYAGAVALRAGGSESLLEESAGDAAGKSGFKVARGTLVLNSPPTTGAYAGNANAVEVRLEENLPRLFTAIFSAGTIDVAGRSVALVGQGQPTCVLALDKAASGAVTFTGSTGAILVGCNVHANSLSGTGVVVSGSATVETPCLSSSGGVSVTSGLTLTECVTPYINADQAADPYAGLPEPDVTQPATTPNVFGGAAGTTYNIGPGRYLGMDIRRTVNMAPGAYVIDGGSLSINSTAHVNGTGVTFYLTNGATLSMNGGADIHLSAPTSGAYSGVVIYVDRNEPFNDYTVNGDSGSTVNGAIYAANGHVRMNGSSTFGGGCTQIVSRTVEFSGNAGIGVDCTGAGVADFRTSRLVTLVE
jgi:Putative Flp pilus-assembly TadE/G-like